MQFETNSLTDAVKEFIGIMKDSGLSYMYVKNDKFELELGQKNLRGDLSLTLWS